MKICPNCGQNAGDEELFCGNCGAALEHVIPVSPGAAFCPGCSAALDSDAVFCPNCGTNTAETSAAETSAAKTSAAKTSAAETSAAETSAAETSAAETSAAETSAAETSAAETSAAETSAAETSAAETAEEGSASPQASPTPLGTPEGVFCPNCGQRMPADTVFCANCGTNINASIVSAPAPTPKAKKPLSHKTIGIAAVAAALVVCVAGISGGIFSSPASQFRDHQKAFLLDGGLNRAAKVLDQLTATPSLSTDLTVTATTDNNEINRYLEDASLGLQIDYQNGALLAGGNLNMMGSEVLGGTVAYEKGILSFSVPELDNTCYSMDVAKMYDALGGTGAAAFTELKIPEIDTATAKKLYTTYFEILSSAVNKDNITVKKTDFRLPQLHKTVSGKVYTFEPSAEDINKMLLKLADMLEKDKTLRDFILSFIKENELLFSFSGYRMGASMMDYEDDLDDAITYIVDEILDNSDQMARQMERSGFRWILGVRGSEICLQRIETNNRDYALGFERFGNNKDGNSICFYTEYSGEALGLINLRWTKDGGSYNGKVSLSNGYSGELVSVSFDQLNLGKTSALHVPYGNYRIQLGGGSIKLEVDKGKNGGTDHVLRLTSLGSLGYYGGDMQAVDVTVNTTDKKSTATRSKAPVVDLTYFSAVELYQLMEDLSDSLQRSAISQFI